MIDTEVLEKFPPREWKNQLEAKYLENILASHETISANNKIRKYINNAYWATLNFNLVNDHINFLSTSYQDHTKAENLNDAISLIEDLNLDKQLYLRILNIIRHNPENEILQNTHNFLAEKTFQKDRELSLEERANRVSEKSKNVDFTSDPQNIISVCKKIKRQWNSTSQSYINYLKNLVDEESKTQKTSTQDLRTGLRRCGLQDGQESEIEKKDTTRANKTISELSEDEIKDWSKEVKNNNISPSREEILATVLRASEIKNRFKPRNTQLVTLLSFLNKSPDSGLLAQVNTGESKSLIVAMLAAVLALEGRVVDVITTLSELIAPELQKQDKFFAMLNLTYENACKNEKSKGENKSVKSEINCHADIVYATTGTMQGDILRSEFMGLKGRQGRIFDVVIVDEVDSMLFDDRSYSTQLCSMTPSAHHLDILLTITWQLAHQKFLRHIFYHQGKSYFIEEDFEVKDGSIRIASDKTLDEVGREITDIPEFIENKVKDVLKQLTRDLSAEESKKYEDLRKLDEKFAELRIRLACGDKYVPGLHTTSASESLINKIKKQIDYHPWKELKNPIIDVPNHLKEFVTNQIPNWAENLTDAIFYKKLNVDYIVENNKICVVDRLNTGVVQKNMVWSDGLTQFLQIKENILMDSEQITTNCGSHVEYFKRYGSNILGLTGTLGDDNTKKFFKDAYNADFVIIPPYKFLPVAGNENSDYICKEFPAIICESADKKIGEIVKTNLLYASCGRACSA